MAIGIKKNQFADPNASMESPPASNENRTFSLGRMRDEFDRLFHRFTRNWPNLWQTTGETTWNWGIEMNERDDALVVKAEAPGFEISDFDIEIDDRRLMVRVGRKTESPMPTSAMSQGRQCYQSILLPCHVDKDRAEATYHNGILTITMPKSTEQKGRKIPVQGL